MEIYIYTNSSTLLIINTELKWKIYISIERRGGKKLKIFITLNYPQMKMWMKKKKTLLLKNQKSRYSENFIQSHFYSGKVFFFFVHAFVCE